MKYIILLFIITLFCNNLSAQEIEVRGIVVDRVKQEPVVGATLRVLGKNVSTFSGAEGEFNLRTNLNDTIEFSYIGALAQRIVVTNAHELRVVLEPSSFALDEVVIVAFGTQSKAELISAISSTKAQDLANMSVASVEQAMQGKMAGVRIANRSGTPGSTTIARVRGASSFSAGNDPLYVIDGMPVINQKESFSHYGHEYLSSLADFNLSDVESIEVLKDAAASALYGARASNGVILITTKRGKIQKPKVTLESYYGVQSLPKKVKFLGADEWLNIQNEARRNYNTDRELAVGNPRYAAPLERNDPFVDTRWIDKVLNKDAPIQNYQLGVAGGNIDTKYFFSLGYFNQEGLVKKNDYERYSFRINLDQKISNTIKAGVNVSLSFANTNRGIGSNNIYSPWSAALQQRPDEAPYDKDGEYQITTNYNPVQSLNETEYNTRMLRGLVGVFGEWNIVKNLTLATNFSADGSYLNEKVYENSRSIQGRADNGAALDGRSLSDSYQTQTTLSYKLDLNTAKLNFLLGQSYQYSESEYNRVSGTNFPSLSLQYIDAATVTNGTSSWGGSSLNSVFARVGASIMDRYLAEFSLRRDGSSKFIGSNRFGYFPAVSAGWRIDNESFFPKNDVFTTFKLRASYGQTGNQEGIGNFVARPILTPSFSYNDKPGFGIAGTGSGNRNLKWEKTTQYNIGLDMAFFKSRLNATFDLFRKDTKDLLMSRSLPSTSGYISITDNIGSLRNEGLELTFQGRILTGEFKWDANLNLTFGRSEVLALNKNSAGEWIGANSGWYQRHEVGHSIASYFLLDYLGVYQNREEIPEALWAQGIRPGDAKYDDVDGNGIINDNDRKLVGNTDPTVYGGFNNTFVYKGFDLSFSAYFSLGNKLYSMWAQGDRGAANLGYGTYAISKDAAKSRWTQDNPSNKVPRAIFGPQGQWNTRSSTRFLENASYLKMKDVTFAYTLPYNISKKAYIEKLRFYVKAQNLFTVTKYSGYDPEVISAFDTGADQGTLPSPRAFLFGMNLTF